MKKYAIQVLGLTLVALVATTASAKDSIKIYSSKKEAEVEQETTYILRRSDKENRFVGRKSEVVSDVELINQAVKAAIAKARDRALAKAYERCYDDYPNCSEIKMTVVETDISDVDTDMEEIDDGFAMRVNKEVKAEAKVRVEVKGEKSKETRAYLKKPTPKQLVLPSDVKETTIEPAANEDEESEEG